ncbi:MAG TPA: hypothetical protein VF173_11845 [Thermoanaerobaculia bacterium]|nr:hypothetical protein [Thermoanaerobaculia bacterium]
MRKNLFGLVIAAAALLAALSVAPAGAADLAGNPAPAAAVTAPSPLPANCGTGVVLPSQTAKAGTCPAAPTAESTVPDFMNPPEARKGFCHCGCSSVRTCHTSADCGGASCDQFVSCC